MSIIRRIIGRAFKRESAPALPELRVLLTEAVRGPDRGEVIALCDAILALEPDDRAALLAAGINRLKTGDPAGAATHFARLDALESGGTQTARLLVESYIDPQRATRGEPYVGTLDEVWVDADCWALIQGNRIYSLETQGRTMANSPRVRGRVTPDLSRCIMTLPREPGRIDVPCILLGSDANYAHWVIRNMLKLALVEDAGLAPGLPYLVAEDLRGWHRAYLELLGIPEARLLRVPPDGVYACPRIHVPTQLRNHPRMAIGIEWLRAKLAPLLAPPAERIELIYASRREQSKRRVLNESAVEQMLSAMGFRVIVPGEMSVREQIDAFSRARVVAGPHGAALANMVFAPPGAVLVEITSQAIHYMDEFRVLVEAAGQRWRTLVSQDIERTRQSATGRELHHDYRVDLEALREMVSEVLAETARS
jgi:capsular polysaccharide biosynthesis protein